MAILCVLSLFAESIEAFPTTWEFSGTVTYSAGKTFGLSEDLPQGTTVRVVVSFDTDEELDQTRASSNSRPGVRYEYFEAESLKFAIFGGDCNPCQPNSVPAKNGMFVRDDFADPARNPLPDEPWDGYSFFIDPHPDNGNLSFLLLTRDLSSNFDPDIVEVGVDENPLPIEPDPRLTQMASSLFEVSDDITKNPVVTIALDLVKIPTIGTWYFLGGRHCLYPDGQTYTGQFLGDECVAGGNPISNGLVTETGGGAGHSNYSNTFTHYLQTPDAGDAPEAVDELGTVYGAINFNGPIGMPILRGSSTPTDLGRTNSNLFAYQQYNFNGTESTPLELVVGIDYSIQNDSVPTYLPPENTVRPNEEIQVGSRPGSARLAVIMAIVDASLVPSVALLTQNFGQLLCGNESQLLLPNGDPWPAGSITGSAVFQSPDIQEGPQTTQLAIRACDGTSISTDPVMVDPGDTFHLIAYMQAPARGKLNQAGQPVATDSGFLDVANTIQVIPDPEAPAEVLQQLTSGIEMVCGNCGPPYVETIFKVGFE